ncbi:sperm acrosome-associated protein 7 [Acomys russatus]|uniref:sperm acrosome-associated protein 7 n=1 Tax=Acomys russatus TaxID=60746 RepID=UPI0021E3054B|nr:sperm acrosome-associated protein 7 [Acomys russatus]
MAANRGADTFFSVLLLCCWRGAELPTINTTLGPITDDSLNSTTDNIPEVFDEILSQEILEPNTTAVSETLTSTKLTTQATSQTKEKNLGADESYQEDASESNYGSQENLEHSDTQKEKTENNEILRLPLSIT